MAALKGKAVVKIGTPY